MAKAKKEKQVRDANSVVTQVDLEAYKKEVAESLQNIKVALENTVNQLSLLKERNRLR